MTTSRQLETDALRVLEERRYRAMVQADVETLDALIADDAVYTHSNGQRDTKQSYLAKVADGRFRYLHIEHPIERIVLAGDCALVVGSMTATVVLAGAQRELNNAALAVWTRAHKSAWQLLGYQPTVLPAS